MTMRSR